MNPIRNAPHVFRYMLLGFGVSNECPCTGGVGVQVESADGGKHGQLHPRGLCQRALVQGRKNRQTKVRALFFSHIFCLQYFREEEGTIASLACRLCGFGCYLVDLSFLVVGLEPPSPRCCRDALTATAMLPPSTLCVPL